MEFGAMFEKIARAAEKWERRDLQRFMLAFAIHSRSICSFASELQFQYEKASSLLEY